MKYEVGDKVKIKTWEELEKIHGLTHNGRIRQFNKYCYFVEKDNLLNKEFPDRILTIKQTCKKYYEMEEVEYRWEEDMIECLAKEYKDLFKEIGKKAKELTEYLDCNSIARDMLLVSRLPVFAVSIYDIPLLHLSSDKVFSLAKKGKTIKDYELRVLINKDLESFSPDGEDIPMSIIEVGAINKSSEKEFQDKKISEKTFGNMKKDLLKEEEDSFIYLVKETAKKNNKYVICDNLLKATEEISKIDYKNIWIPNKFLGNDLVKDMPNKNHIYSSNLQGFILSHSDISTKRGIFTIKDDIVIIPDYESFEFVSFEPIGMMLFNKELTYIEVN